jgi:superfamily II DNA or RNA helicase
VDNTKKILDKNKIQEKATAAALRNKFGTLFLGPGSGKSKIVIDIGKALAKEKNRVLKALFVSTRGIIIEQFLTKELSKWGDSTVEWQACTIQKCHRANYTSTFYVQFDLIIFDEIDDMVSENMKYASAPMEFTREVTRNNLDIRIIGTTGSLEGLNRELVQKWLPVIFSLSFEETQKYNLVNSVITEVHLVPLDDEILIERSFATSGKKVKWKTTDLQEYFRLRQVSMQEEWPIISQMKLELSVNWRKMNNLPELTKEQEANLIIKLEAMKKNYDTFKNLFQLSRDNKVGNPIWDFFTNLDTTAREGRKMVDKLEKEGHRTLVFTVFEEHLRKCTDYVYSSKTNSRYLDLFELNQIRHLGVMKKVDRGKSFEDVTRGVTLMLNKSSTPFLQMQLGRGTRLDKSQIYKNIVLCPSIMNEEGEEFPIDYILSKFKSANKKLPYKIFDSKGRLFYEHSNFIEATQDNL